MARIYEQKIMRVSHAACLVLLCGCWGGRYKDTAQAVSKPWVPKPSYSQPVITFKVPDIPVEEGDVPLASLVDVALKNNPDTEISWAQARSASAAHAMSLAPFLPEINLEGDAMRTHNVYQPGDANTASHQTSAGGIGTLTYTLYDFGERSANAEATMQALYHANWNHNDSIQTVMRNTIDSYYNFLYQKALLVSKGEDLKDAETTYRAALTKLEVGVADVSDMLQAKTRYLEVQLEFTQQEDMKEIAYVDLLNVLGAPSDLKVQLGSFPDKPEMEALNNSAEELLAIGQAKRPSIAAAKANYLESQAELARAKSEFWPTLDTTIMGSERAYQGNPNQYSYELKLALNFPIFVGFKDVNRVREMKANVEKAKGDLRRQELLVSRQIMTQYSNFTSARKLVVFARDYLEAAGEDYVAVLSNYEMGTNTIIDVLNAQAALANARSQYDDAKNKLFSSIGDLAYATGTLSEDEL